jgi:hypothetical protein
MSGNTYDFIATAFDDDEDSSRSGRSPANERRGITVTSSLPRRDDEDADEEDDEEDDREDDEFE